MIEAEAKPDNGSISSGFFLGIVLCIGQAIVTWVIVQICNSLVALIAGIYLFGLFQLVYMVPVYLFLRKRRLATATGLAITACLVALVNVTCAAVIH